MWLDKLRKAWAPGIEPRKSQHVTITTKRLPPRFSREGKLKLQVLYTSTTRAICSSVYLVPQQHINRCWRCIIQESQREALLAWPPARIMHDTTQPTTSSTVTKSVQLLIVLHDYRLTFMSSRYHHNYFQIVLPTPYTHGQRAQTRRWHKLMRIVTRTHQAFRNSIRFSEIKRCWALTTIPLKNASINVVRCKRSALPYFLNSRVIALSEVCNGAYLE